MRSFPAFLRAMVGLGMFFLCGVFVVFSRSVWVGCGTLDFFNILRKIMLAFLGFDISHAVAERHPSVRNSALFLQEVYLARGVCLFTGTSELQGELGRRRREEWDGHDWDVDWDREVDEALLWVPFSESLVKK